MFDGCYMDRCEIVAFVDITFIKIFEIYIYIDERLNCIHEELNPLDVYAIAVVCLGLHLFVDCHCASTTLYFYMCWVGPKRI